MTSINPQPEPSTPIVKPREGETLQGKEIEMLVKDVIKAVNAAEKGLAHSKDSCYYILQLLQRTST